ncbi:hypothetical protein [Crocosphaera sp. XPORK-15E]|uniref:hypothetical protein n=1 Tax=Crocosphaera sp. XPORK-15E TaxID=3110247 RepID=UPI002B1E9D71|nr:hypothetical protein [Crocosphaera sp. XPORK-15E]MEA5532979.1 hypothetical protein [Crocosphaera sp. XPORK-15E]
MNIKTPVVIYDQGDVLIFESIKIAESYLESIDIPGYLAYDCEGRLLKLIPEKQRVKIELAESESSHQHQLQQILIDFLTKLGHDFLELSQMSLGELVTKSLVYKTQ